MTMWLGLLTLAEVLVILAILLLKDCKNYTIVVLHVCATVVPKGSSYESCLFFTKYSKYAIIKCYAYLLYLVKKRHK